MTRNRKQEGEEELSTKIEAIKTRRVMVNLIGGNLVAHRYAFKAWQELLLPSRKKNAQEREESLKHDPLQEYQDCFYINRRNTKSPTLFHLPIGMPSKAMAAAALDIPGSKKAEIQRLVRIVSDDLLLYGRPELFMSMVRNSDQARTPDVRTRPIFPRWAVPNVWIEYKMDPLNDTQIFNLMGAAGKIVGFGDWRPQKGGNFGCFRVVGADDKELRDIMKEGRAVQQRAFDNPTYYDDDTEDLMRWFNEEVARREKEVPSRRGNVVSIRKRAAAAKENQ